MTEILRYAAFTDDPARGNPAGVVLDAELGAEEMQSIAAEIGYSETAFAVPVGPGEYSLRYFSPLAEVAFCGHATIATAIALAERSATTGTLRFTTSAGPIGVDAELIAGRYFATLTSVETTSRAAEESLVRETLAALRWDRHDLDPRYPVHIAFAGNEHPIMAARSRERLAELDYDFAALKALMEREDWTTIQLFWPESETVFHARDPFPVGGVVEDPATGAAAAALGGYLRAIGEVRVPREITIIQGEDMGRRSELTLGLDPDDRRSRVTGSAVRIP